MNSSPEPTQQEIDFGLRLLEGDEENAFSFLGIQAERLEIAQARSEQGRAVPDWSNDDAVAKVLSAQRASKEDLLRYFHKGVQFTRNIMVKIEAQLRGILCEGRAVRKEISELKDGSKEVIRYVASLVAGVLLTSLPGAVTIAVTSIATTIAVILIKRNLTQFCAVGIQTLA
jgi:hypothetical protein